MSDIDKMAQTFESEAELKQYSNAQYRTILAQAKKIGELETKVRELEKQLINGTQTPDEASSLLTQIVGMSDEEAIAVMEISKLKQISLERELANDECKRFEIYSKSLINLRASKKVKGVLDGLGEITDSDILSALIDEK